MKPMYKVTQYVSKFMKVGDDYQTVEVPNELVFDWDGLVAFIGCLAEGGKGPHKIEFKTIEKEA